jgi:hypothetical protein
MVFFGMRMPPIFAKFFYPGKRFEGSWGLRNSTEINNDGYGGNSPKRN